MPLGQENSEVEFNGLQLAFPEVDANFWSIKFKTRKMFTFDFFLMLVYEATYSFTQFG